MEILWSEVETVRSKTLPMEEALIMPIGDVQFGAAECDVERFKKHIKWGVEQGAYFIGMGDMVDFGSPSNRGKLRALIDKGELYDTASDVLDNAALEHLEQLEEILEPTRGRWLGLVEGHHYWEWPSGQTSDTKLCEFLDAPFLGTCGIVEVRFKAPRDQNHGRSPRFQIWVHHGRGSGQMQSAPLNKLENLLKHWPSVQVFFMAHQHKKVSAKLQQLVPVMNSRGSGKLRHRNVVIAGTGGFLRGYMVGSKKRGRAAGAYPEQGMMNPVALGGVVLKARPRYSGRGDADVDLEISL